jgi:tetratricopeptide (TPR) repeat protein
MVGSLLRMAGAPDEAMAHLLRAAELLDAVPDHLRAGVARGEVGLCNLHQGDAQRGLTVLEASAEHLSEHGVGGYFCGSVRNGLAEGYLLLAEQAQGTERAAALKRAQRACTSAVREARLDREALPAAYRLQGRYEWLATREKAAIDCWKQSVGLAEELGARYELGLTYLEMGKRQDNSERLNQAEEVFDRIHFRPDARQIRAELYDPD